MKMENRYILKIDNYGRFKKYGYLQRLGLYSISICSDIYRAKPFKTLKTVEKSAKTVMDRFPDVNISILTIKIVIEDDRVY